MTSLTLRTISTAEHLDFLQQRYADGGSASFLQTPAWAAVKSEWRAESIGWTRAGDPALVGAALVLYRQLPKIKRFLAYLPEGPVLDWDTDDLAAALEPLAAHLKKQGAFGVRIGPPVTTARWDAAAIKQGIADEAVTSLIELTPTERNTVGATVVSQLQELGWRRQGGESGFAAGQPMYNFQIPLAGRTEDDVLAGMNQLWRRNIKKAAKLGVEVTHLTPDSDGFEAALARFHDLYVLTAQRDGFTPRPAAYFTTMFKALHAEDPDRIRLYLAEHEGDLVASTIWIRVGSHAWYSYGASSTEKREVRGSNAVQWQMIRDAIATGATVYDLRGITVTLDPADSHAGLIQFKVGTGGEAVAYAGEWDLPLNRALYKAFELYLARRSR